MIKCEECRYWVTGDRSNFKENFGECKKKSPLLDPHGRGTWPLVNKNNGCYDGKYKDDGVLNE